MIYHVCTAAQWAAAQAQGFYSHDSIAAEGFIHCSKLHQVAGVLQRYYSGIQDLLLLHIDESLLSNELKYELAPSIQEEFPHVFGSINLDAVVAVEPIA
ncbi:MAG: hypothetical protein RL660_1577 [Bacteroidota bacterium]|jgi:uncharacterized protein (DUF952 family)